MQKGKDGKIHQDNCTDSTSLIGLPTGQENAFTQWAVYVASQMDCPHCDLRGQCLGRGAKGNRARRVSAVRRLLPSSSSVERNPHLRRATRWVDEELGKRSDIERFFGRVFLFFRLQRPPLSGWSTMVRQVALTYTATIIVALAAQQTGRPDLIRSPKRVLAHVWEGL